MIYHLLLVFQFIINKTIFKSISKVTMSKAGDLLTEIFNDKFSSARDFIRSFSCKKYYKLTNGDLMTVIGRCSDQFVLVKFEGITDKFDNYISSVSFFTMEECDMAHKYVNEDTFYCVYRLDDKPSDLPSFIKKYQ